nr:hypothetical protein [Ningiella sp. W23]
MPNVLIKYNSEDQLKVDAYNNLDEDRKSGEYWDDSDGQDLKKIKKTSKHFISNLKVIHARIVGRQLKLIIMLSGMLNI